LARNALSEALPQPNLPRPPSAWTPLTFTLFRWLWIASVVSNVGTWMQNVAAAWYMTALPTSTPLLVALVTTATNLPVFLLGVPAGVAGDIFDRRKLLLVTQGWMLAAAAALGALTLAGLNGPYTLLWLTFALGLGAAMNGPVWQAIMPELVPQRELPAAIALNSVGFNLARAIGPALGGLTVAAMGAGAAFVLNAISFVAVLAVLYFWKRQPAPFETQPAEGVMAAMLTGMRYVQRMPVMRSVLLRSFTFVLWASAIWALLPVLAKVELHRESTGYGVLLAFLGFGSILAALILSQVRHLLKRETIVTAGVILYGLANVGLAVTERYELVCGLMIAAGIGWMTANSNLNTAAQTALPAWLRSRGMGVYLLGFQSSMAIGSVIWGTIASRFGLRVTLFAAGVLLLATALATLRLSLTGDARTLDAAIPLDDITPDGIESQHAGFPDQP